MRLKLVWHGGEIRDTWARFKLGRPLKRASGKGRGRAQEEKIGMRDTAGRFGGGANVVCR